jgi:hypothetical protein
MIQFTIYTQVSIVKDPPSTFPPHVYRLTNFEQIPNIVGQTDCFVGNKKSTSSGTYAFAYIYLYTA